MTAEAVNGDELTFDLSTGVMVNDANVVTPDVATSNGIIHVIDKVLMPPADPVDIPTCCKYWYSQFTGSGSSSG